jgi:tRNA threonylcarbamoyladenosine biosynthesis protein TsaB
MKLLALEASADTVSVAIQKDSDRVQDQLPASSKSSSWLIPRILQLLAESDLSLHLLDGVVFGQGPGAFTGLRTVCSVVQGLSLGLKPKPIILGIDTLMELAHDAFSQIHPTDTLSLQSNGRSNTVRCLSILDARMGQWYVGAYERVNDQWLTTAKPLVCDPLHLVVPTAWQGRDFIVSSNVEPPILEKIMGLKNLPPAAALIRSSPSARLCLDLAMLGSTLYNASMHGLASPLYVRERVAFTTLERSLIKPNVVIEG